MKWIAPSLLFAFALNAQPLLAFNPPLQKDGDSTEVQLGSMRIRVDDNDESSFKITIDSANVGEADQNKKVTTEWALFDFGINMPLQDGSFQPDASAAPFDDLRYGHSWNIDMQIFRQRVSLVKRKFNLEYGLGFSWYNYGFQNDVLLEPNADAFAFEESDAALRKSKLAMTYLTVPLMLNVETNPNDRGSSFRISAGMSGGVRIASRTKVKTEDKLKLKQRDDFNLNAFRYGPVLRVGYGWFNVYAQYALTDLFVEGEGPALTPLTIGISLRAF